MIILDTNVVSEAMRPVPNPAVIAWLNNQVSETLYLSSITVAELLFGAAALPDGKRKTTLTALSKGFIELFEGRILPFDVNAATNYAELASAARAKGRGLPLPDGYIAAIAESNKFKVASRDVAPFQAANIDIVNPWDT